MDGFDEHLQSQCGLLDVTVGLECEYCMGPMIDLLISSLNWWKFERKSRVILVNLQV